MKKGFAIQRFHTSPGTDPLDKIEYELRECKISNPDGSIIFSGSGKIPKHWSKLAGDIAISKYFRVSGLAKGGETSVKQLIYRIAHTIREAGEGAHYFSSKKEADSFEAELSYLLVHQHGAFNSPVWFNTGIYQRYGIKGSGSNYTYNEKKKCVEKSNGSYIHPQSSACFIQGVEDDLDSIFELVKKEALLFKYGSGTGTNFSKIRGAMEPLSSGGKSSGLLSFLEVLDRGAGATKSGGTSRRAAKMVCLDIDHPEIRNFIHWKEREEKKVAALVAAGYSADFNGEAYKTVSGQNSNNSVRIPDSFFRAVEAGKNWSTKLRTTGKVYESFSAKELFREIATAARACADPGILYETTIHQSHTCPNDGPIFGTNPCAEYMFLDDTACNLASINLLKYVNTESEFDIAAFSHTCRIFYIAQEILIDFSGYPSETIAKNSHDFRPLGLGYANLGALLMVLGLSYDCEAAQAWCSGITALMQGEALSVSAEIAAIKGPFAAFKKNKLPMLKVIRKQLLAAKKISKACPESLRKSAQRSMDHAWKMGNKFGFRNAQSTLIAPTGTISLLMDCDTTGIEPEFALVKTKKLAGGGSIKMVNRSVSLALANLGYEKEIISKILSHMLERGDLQDCKYLKAEHLSIFHSAREIAPHAHLKMMAAAQPFLSGAISKTVNLAKEASVADIEELYLEAWRLGLKSLAIYRDGSKISQPLSADANLNPNPACPICGHATMLDGACYRCHNCGHSLSCG